MYDPVPEDLIIEHIRPKLRGGGQKAQKAHTGCRVRHVPTNTVVDCSDKRRRGFIR